MALCKFFRGKEEDLAQQPLTDGYVWVTNNNGVLHMYMDYIDENDELVRKQLNATDKQVRQIIANALKGSVGGETVLLEDVSPVEHTIKVQLSSEDITDFSDIKVKVSDGNDLIAYPYPKDESVGGSFKVVSEGVIEIISSETDNFTLSFGIPMFIGGSVCLSGIPKGIVPTVYVTKDWTGEGDIYESPVMSTAIPTTEEGYFDHYFDIDGEISFISLEILWTETPTVGSYIYPRLEKVGLYTPTSDGVVKVQSFSPIMTFGTNVEGVNIEVEYNKDINKAVSKNIIDGQGKESIQVFSGNAFADNSVAIGKNSVAGQKAYHIAAIDFTNHFIFLSNEKTTPVVLKSETEYAPYINTNFVSPEYSVGNNEDEEPDEFSLIIATGIENWTHYHFIAKITSISNNVIGYDIDLPITELYENSEEYVNTFFVASKPMIGAFNLMYGGFAEGEYTIASGRGSHAEGIETIAAGFYGHAEGRETRASYAAHSEGINTTASGIYSHAEGRNGTASGVGAHAEGYEAVVSGKYSHGEGNKVTVEGNAAHAEGESTKATADYSHAEGYSTTASAKGSHSEGRDTASSGEYSHAEGFKTKATMLATHSEGFNTSAEAIYSHAEGENTIAASRSQHVQGKWNIKDDANKYAHIIGNGTGENSRANAHTVDWSGNGWFAGNVTVGSGKKLLATEEYVNTNISKSIVGKKLSGGSEIFNDYTNNVASGNYVHTEGYNNKIYAGFSHGEGRENKIETGSSFSHVEGYKNTIGEKVNSAHAEGQENNINHDAHYSHVEGFGNTISARGGHAEGIGTVAASWYQHVQGRYNEIDSNPSELGKYAHIVGNGKDANNRKNIHTVDWSGNAWFAGGVTVGMNNDKLVTEADMDAKLANYVSGSDVGQQSVGDHAEIFNDYENNSAFGPYAKASGYNTIAGITGYYFAKLELDDTNTVGVFYLSDTQYAEEIEDTSTLSKDFVINYAEGDVVSYISGSKYLDIGSITAIDHDNKIITVTATVEGTLKKGAFDTGVDDQILYVYAKPGVGIANFGHYAVAEGEETIAVERSSHAEGRQTVARGQYAHAEGRGTVASYAAHAEGYKSNALANYAHAEGYTTKAVAMRSHAEGNTTKAEGDAAHAEGTNTVASGIYSHAEGYATKSVGSGSHAEGNTTKAEGNFSHAEGQQTYAKGLQAHAEGLTSKALGGASHAEGQKTEASGERAHAEGYESIASGNQAHAEGQSTVASGDIAHAEGKSTLASGIASHAEGYRTEAVGGYAHTEGEATKALKPSTHAEGLGTVADSVYQHVQGKYNIEDGNGAYAHIVGNGNDDENRSNAHTLDWNGNAWFAGDVTLGKDNVSVAQTFNDIINDLTTRPTAEWAEEVANDLGKKDEKISELEGYIDDCIENLDTHERLIDDNAITIKENEQASRQIFANALIGSATGEAFCLNDISPVEHNLEVKVRKKNLLPFPYTEFPNGAQTIEKNGLTIFINDKGVITLNGTATNTTIIELYNATNSLPTGIKYGDTITISKNCSDETQQKLFSLNLMYYDINGNRHSSGTTITIENSRSTIIPDTWAGCALYLGVQKDGVFDNLTLKPQIELGSVATDWTPYLAEDISTVKLNVLGKNLVDITTAQLERSLYGGGAGSTVDVVGVGKTASAAYAAVITYVPVLPNTTYSFSLNNSTYWLNRICQMNSNNICIINHAFYVNTANDYSEYTFTTNADTRYLMIQLKNKNEVAPTMEDLLKINLQIEQGSATEYEAYKEPVEYTVNPDGTVTDVVSIYPSITLATDTIGAVIDCEYNRDINKAFAELANAIIALGGNV